MFMLMLLKDQLDMVNHHNLCLSPTFNCDFLNGKGYFLISPKFNPVSPIEETFAKSFQ